MAVRKPIYLNTTGTPTPTFDPISVTDETEVTTGYVLGQASAPATPPGGTGKFYYDSTLSKFRFNQGGSWINFGTSVWTDGSGYLYPTDGATINAVVGQITAPDSGIKFQVIGNFKITQSAATSGTPRATHVISGAHIGLTASTEVPSVDLDFSATKQWATGAITTQREGVVRAPTYSFVATSTVSTAATWAVTGAPIAGTNAVLTNPLALWVQSGKSQFGGDISCPGAGASSERFGVGSLAAGSNAFAFGSFASAAGASSVAIGGSASAPNTNGIVLGTSSSIGADGAIAIGGSVIANGVGAVAIGNSSEGRGDYSVAVGQDAATAVGHTGSVTVGFLATSTAGGQLIVGGDLGAPYTLLDSYWGRGVLSATPTTFSFNGTSGSGTNIVGGALRIAGGRSTGNALGGSVTIATSPSGGSGSSLNTATDRFIVKSLGQVNLVPITGDPATLADGDLWYNVTTNKFRKQQNGLTTDLDESGSPGWVDDGANVRLITASDSVIIGATTGTQKLEVRDNSATVGTRMNYNNSVLLDILADSTGYGLIRTASAHELRIGVNSTNWWMFDSTGHLVPLVNDTQDLGYAGFRVRDVYVNDSVKVYSGSNNTGIDISSTAISHVRGEAMQWELQSYFDSGSHVVTAPLSYCKVNTYTTGNPEPVLWIRANNGSTAGDIKVRMEWDGSLYRSVLEHTADFYLATSTTVRSWKVSATSPFDLEPVTDNFTNIGSATKQVKDLYLGNALLTASLGSDPTAIRDGQLFYRSDTDAFRGRRNGAWVNLAAEGDGPTWTVTTTKTANYTAVIGDWVRYDPSGGGFTITLPAATTGNKGKTVGTKNITTSTNTVTVDVTGGGNIDSSATFSMSGSREANTFISNGVDWEVM